jgi:hypothetical protein
VAFRPSARKQHFVFDLAGVVVVTAKARSLPALTCSTD